MMDQNDLERLGEDYNRFVLRQVATGEFSDSDEVLRAALRLLQRRQRKLDALRLAIRESDESCRSEPFDVEAFLTEMHEKSDAE